MSNSKGSKRLASLVSQDTGQNFSFGKEGASCGQACETKCCLANDKILSLDIIKHTQRLIYYD